MKPLDRANVHGFAFGENLDKSLLVAHSPDKPGHAPGPIRDCASAWNNSVF